MTTTAPQHVRPGAIERTGTPTDDALPDLERDLDEGRMAT
jgi:hypothetical protein